MHLPSRNLSTLPSISLPKLGYATKRQLLRYARVLVQVGLNGGEGINSGDVVQLVGNQFMAEYFLPYLAYAVVEAGGHPVSEITYEPFPGRGVDTIIGLYGTDDQIDYRYEIPAKLSARAADHRLVIKSSLWVGEENPHSSVAGVKRRAKGKSVLQYRRKLLNDGQLTTSLAYLPTESVAGASGLSVYDVWDQIVKSLYLNDDDCIEYVRTSLMATQHTARQLTQLHLRELSIQGENVDLRMQLNERAIWRGGTGANMPSFECFSTPEASSTSGWVKFDYPFLYDGTEISGLTVWFEAGRVVGYECLDGREAFERMLEFEGAGRLGEVAFTDRQSSQIDRAIPSMTMFIENMGGTGHVAFGQGYQKCFVDGDPANADINQSRVHQDVVFGGNFTVVGIDKDSQQHVIFQDGQFVL